MEGRVVGEDEAEEEPIAAHGGRESEHGARRHDPDIAAHVARFARTPPRLRIAQVTDEAQQREQRLGVGRTEEQARRRQDVQRGGHERPPSRTFRRRQAF